MLTHTMWSKSTFFLFVHRRQVEMMSRTIETQQDRSWSAKRNMSSNTCPCCRLLLDPAIARSVSLPPAVGTESMPSPPAFSSLSSVFPPCPWLGRVWRTSLRRGPVRRICSRTNPLCCASRQHRKPPRGQLTGGPRRTPWHEGS